ncbi:MAG: VWA domain-containing protein [Chloroflexi bacterium]|nr:VWA domain-containing protein [Chloroflexota bacterium]
MQFLWPYMLWLLLLIPLLVIIYILAQRRRQRYALRYASLSLVKQALGRGPGIRRHIPAAVFLLALTAMIVGLARPVSVIAVPSAEGTVILTIDTSGSMAADDLKPSRMEAAKAAARDFVQHEPQGVRIGVVSFSDDAFIVQPPTTDQQSVLAAIDRLYPQRGTAIGRGLVVSLNAVYEALGAKSADIAQPTPDPNGQGFGSFGLQPFGQSFSDTLPPAPPGVQGPLNSATIVLLTDGENNQGPDPVGLSRQIAQRGVRVYTVGIGSPEGSILHIAGRAIRTRLDEGTLKQIAQETNGVYFNALHEEDLAAIYNKLTTQFIVKTEKTEVTAVLTGLAAVLSILGGFLSLLWFNRLP